MVRNSEGPVSFSRDGRFIHCDGKLCHEAAQLPVGLRSDLKRDRQPTARSVNGWLFITSEGKTGHFCPKCSAAYIVELGEER